MEGLSRALRSPRVEITDDMLSAALGAYADHLRGIGGPVVAMRAALTAALGEKVKP